MIDDDSWFILKVYRLHLFWTLVFQYSSGRRRITVTRRPCGLSCGPCAMVVWDTTISCATSHAQLCASWNRPMVTETTEGYRDVQSQRETRHYSSLFYSSFFRSVLKLFTFRSIWTCVNIVQNRDLLTPKNLKFYPQLPGPTSFRLELCPKSRHSIFCDAGGQRSSQMGTSCHSSQPQPASLEGPGKKT